MTVDLPQPRAQISRAAFMDAPETLKLMMALCGGVGDKTDEARFVGGCVRDTVLNVKTYDIDIATIHTPDVVMARLKANGIKAIPTGIEHGTVTAVIDDHPFEITTLRRDIETDGRHATVAFTDRWEEDAARRDFTMNALYCTIQGDVYDYFGGLEDARAGRVKFIRDPGERIREDYLRILRFYRFSARFSDPQKMDGEARRQCRAHAEELKSISVERIQSELIKILATPRAAWIWQMMTEDGIAHVILPMGQGTDVLQALVKTEELLDAPADPIRRLAALLGESATQDGKCKTGLKLSNADQNRLCRLVSIDPELNATTPEHQLRAAVYRNDPDYVRSAVLLNAAKTAHDPFHVRKTIEAINKIRLPAFPLTGKDAIEQGLKPGPEIGDVLSRVEDWWIAQDFLPGRMEALKKLKTLIDQN